ncbi:hypothetical protein BDR07DRAFT_1490691 [Suillus spraguei]|nr:hypothetical protein BDR07DRAFT_1490691 [Suillus spraguei]
MAEDEGWMKLEWWKLHLQTKNLTANHIVIDDISLLPRGKNAVEESHVNGSNLWRSSENRFEFVFTHPNGWEGPQQTQIRIAAVLSGLIPSTEDGMARVHLLTEGEACLHYCVANILASDAFSTTPILLASEDGEDDNSSPGQGVVVINAGGERIDLSAYSITLSRRWLRRLLQLNSLGRLQGSCFVTRRAHSLLQEKLSGSRFGTPDVIQRMTDIFDSTTKWRFRNPEDSQYIKFGTIRDKDKNPQYNIRNGQLKLSGQDVADLFEPSISSIVEAFETQRKATGIPITFVFFTGSFAVSDWMFTKLQEYFQSLGISFGRPDSDCNKAVADGAVSYFIDRLVGTAAGVIYNDE